MGWLCIEFKGDVLRAFGVQPAFYLAGSLPGVGTFNDAGGELAYFLSETRELLGKFWDLKDKPQPKEIEDATKLVLAQVFDGKYEFQRLFFTAQALLNLYYHTDKSGSEPLHFFQQREWKIIPCFAFGGEDFPYPKLTESEKDELLKLNSHFFAADVLGRRRVDECRYFSAVGKSRVIEGINRIIVPNVDVASQAADLVRLAGLRIPVVTISTLPVDVT